MGIDIRITMKSGKIFELVQVEGDMPAIQKQMSRVKFMRFGPIIVNSAEVESIVKV